jgi:hypothetical protein
VRAASLTTAAPLNVAGLLVTAVGIALERGAGSTLYPTLAGPIVLVGAAALVAWRPTRWTRYVGVFVSLVLAAGLIVSAALSPVFLDQLTNTKNPGTLVGSTLHVVGLAAALAGGMAMVLRPHGGRMTQLGAP